MSYNTVAEYRAFMSQVPAGAVADTLIQSALDSAHGIVTGRQHFTYAAWGAATTRDVQAVGDGELLQLPPHQASSVTIVAQITGRGTTGESTAAITDYVQEAAGWLWRGQGWQRGVWYRVTAVWGVGPVPECVKEVEREIAVSIMRGADSGQYSDVIGVEGGGAVGYARALTNRQRQTLDDERVRLFGVVIA